MVGTFAGLMALFFGWLCLGHARLVRARYSEDRPRRSRFRGEKPLMIVPSALGVLLLIDGLALLALAAVERLDSSGTDASGVGPDVIMTLAFVAAAVVALFWSGVHLYRGVTSARREEAHNERARCRTAPAAGNGRKLPPAGVGSGRRT